MGIADGVLVEVSAKFMRSGIQTRLKDLNRLAELITKRANKLSTYGNVVKFLTIVFGALVASKGLFDTVLGTQHYFNLAMFSFLGVLISACAGIEAAFKFEKRGAELIVLGTQCQSAIREIDAKWRKNLGPVSRPDSIEAARSLLSEADQRLSEIQESAARLGINFAFFDLILEEHGLFHKRYDG